MSLLSFLSLTLVASVRNRRGEHDQDSQSRRARAPAARPQRRSRRASGLPAQPAITTIQVTLMTLRPPESTSARCSSRRSRAQTPTPSARPPGSAGGSRRLSGVSSYTPAAIATAPAMRDPCGRYTAYTATPTSVQTARYDPMNNGASRSRPPARTLLATAGAAPGSIIAAIIATHTPTKNQNEPSRWQRPCPSRSSAGQRQPSMLPPARASPQAQRERLCLRLSSTPLPVVRTRATVGSRSV